jgi:nicotinate-nucleotide adenylyltransferase
MKIGLFGGTFDPAHVGHLLVAQHARELLGLDRLVLIPSATSPHKRNRILTPAEHRLAMLRIAVAGVPHFEVSDAEVRRGGVSYSIDTLRVMQREHPGAELTLLIGLDNVADFGTWRDPEGILSLAEVAVLARPGYRNAAPGDPFARRMRLCAVPEIDIASRDIRRRVREHRSIHWMVPPEVENYIYTHGFYLTSET